MPRWAWLATLAIACGQPASPTSTASPRQPESPVVAPADAAVAPRPEPGAELANDLPRLAARARELYLDWAAAFSDASIDCTTATGRIETLADRYADVAAGNRAVFAAGRDRVRALRAELERYEAEMGALAKSIMESPVMSRCAAEARFASAIDRLQGDR